MQFKNEDRKGYMRKLKNSTFNRIFGNTNLRWFELNFIDKTFGYKDDHTSPILRHVIKFSEIKDINEKLRLDEKGMCEWQYGFCLRTKQNREYVLYCQTKTELEQWIKGFEIVLNKNPQPESQPQKKPIIRELSINREIPKIEYRAPQTKPSLPKKEKPVVVQPEPVKKKKIINENVTNKALNSSQMLYDQELSDFIDDVNKSVDIEDNYMSTNNLNRSYNSNNSQILVNLKLDDWNYYDEEGKKMNDANNSNKEYIEEAKKEKLIKILKEQRKKKVLAVENLHNSQAKGKNIIKHESFDNNEYQDKKKTFELLEEFIEDKHIISNIAKANLKNPINKTNSVVAIETIKKIQEEEARKEKFNRHRVKSLLNKKERGVNITENDSVNSSFQEIMLENYVKNKKQKVKLTLKFTGKSKNENSFNSNNDLERSNSKNESINEIERLNKKQVFSNNTNKLNVIQNNSKLLQRDENLLKYNKEKLKQDLVKLQEKYR